MNKLKIVRYIIVHHSAEEDCPDLDYASVLRYHTDPKEKGGLGFEDIGYHAFVEKHKTKSGSPTYITIDGRSEIYQGAHTIGANFDSLGICFAGNFEEKEPPEDLLIAGARRIAAWLNCHDLNSSAIIPHRQFNPTKCPGKMFPMDRLRKMVLSI